MLVFHDKKEPRQKYDGLQMCHFQAFQFEIIFFFYELLLFGEQ
jgi:hypothetical protein